MKTETTISMPILNPATKGRSQTFDYWGKIDLVEGDRLVDWKGTDDPDRFIRQKKLGLQGECYALALQAAGQRITEIEYRLITRPTLHYTLPTYRYAVTREGRKTALRVYDTREKAEEYLCFLLEGCYIQERITGDVDRNAFENRCFEWLKAEPSRLVAHTLFLTESRLQQARQMLWDISKRILDNRTNNRWIMNEGACFAYRRECSCMPLCEAKMDGAALPEEFAEVANVHPELGDVDPNGRDVLTYTSSSTFKTCEMKHYWLYERGLRRERDEGDPLWIGSAAHVGLAAYASTGLDNALAAINEWGEAQLVLGERDTRLQDERIAKARAMVRAAALKWPVEQGVQA